MTLRVSEANIRVYKINEVDGDDEEEDLPIQISPVFDSEGQISNTEFELSFLAQVKGFGLKTFYIVMLRPEEGKNDNMDVAKIKIHNSVNHPFQVFYNLFYAFLHRRLYFQLSNIGVILRSREKKVVRVNECL